MFRWFWDSTGRRKNKHAGGSAASAHVLSGTVCVSVWGGVDEQLVLAPLHVRTCVNIKNDKQLTVTRTFQVHTVDLLKYQKCTVVSQGLRIS